MTMPCSLRGTNLEALHNPTVGTSIMSEFQAKNLLSNMPAVPTNRLFRNPSGLIFKCGGIVWAMPIEINETKVHLDFHIFAILEFDLLIGYPLEKLFQEKPFHGSLDKKLGTTASTTPIPHLKILMVKQLPNHNLFEEMKFITLFASPSPSLELKTCPSGHPNIIFNSGLDSIDASLENKNSRAMDICETLTLEYKRRDSINEHESFTFETPHISCSISKYPEFVSLSIMYFYEGHNHLLILVYKLFKRMVVDDFVYHKYCKSCRCTVVLTL